jgi:chromosome segregation ATPase
MKNVIAIMLKEQKTRAANEKIHRDTEIAELKEQMADSYAQSAELREQMAHRHTEITNLKDQMTYQYAGIAELKEQMAQRYTEITDLKEQLQHMREAYEERLLKLEPAPAGDAHAEPFQQHTDPADESPDQPA